MISMENKVTWIIYHITVAINEGFTEDAAQVDARISKLQQENDDLHRENNELCHEKNEEMMSYIRKMMGYVKKMIYIVSRNYGAEKL